MLKYLGIFLSLLVFTPMVSATDSLPPVLDGFIKLGRSVTPIGNHYGLRAYFVGNNGKGITVYVTPDGLAQITGVMWDKRMRNVTASQLALNSDVLSFSKAQPPTTENEGMLIGSEGPILSAFLSPTCAHCRLFWYDIGQRIKNHELRVLVYAIPSGSTEKELQRSYKITSLLLSQPNPAEAFILYSQGKSDEPTGQATEKALLQIQKNVKLFSDFNFNKTPSFVGHKEKDLLVKASGWPIALENLLPRYN